MKNYLNWGHVYGIIFNQELDEKFDYNTFSKSLKESIIKREVFPLENHEGELVFISKFKEYNDGYTILIGRTNEEISKTKINTKSFKTKDIDFDENEHISDYTHIFISKKNISKTTNSYYLLLEKNQRVQIGIVRTLIGNIIGYKHLENKEKSKLYLGAIMQSDYIKKLLSNEIIGKSIVINENKTNMLNLPDEDKSKTITKTTQISKFENGAKFLNSLNFLIKNPKSHEDKDVLLIVDDGKNKNKQIPFESDFLKYVPFFQLPSYVKSVNKDINEQIVEQFAYVVNNNEYEVI